jgi:membrane protease YdiL (CAAX protease family)
MPKRPEQNPPPVWLFFAIACAFSWIVWLFPLLSAKGIIPLPPSAKVPLLMLGAFGPFVAAFVMLYAGGGTSAMVAFARRALRYRLPFACLVASLLLFPLLAFLAATIWATQGGPPVAIGVSLGHVPMLLLVLFFLGGSFQEEFGWAYAIDRLGQRFALLPATIVLGLIWGCWHLPLFFITGLSQSFMPFWAFIVLTVSVRVIYVWAYEAAQKSILATLVFHTSLNFSFNVFTLLQSVPHGNENGFVDLALLSALAASAIAVTYAPYRVGISG